MVSISCRLCSQRDSERLTLDRKVPGSLWFYAPDKGAPVFFAVAFGASTVWQIWQT